MARFRFRLKGSLRMAERTLEQGEREFAREMRHWKSLVEACEIQQGYYNNAQEGQREAGRHRPEELGIWRLFASEQKRRLQKSEEELSKQKLLVENARHRLLEAHREVEKLERLKEKQSRAFQFAELQKEQKILDETGQVLHWHKHLFDTRQTEGLTYD